MKSVVMRRQQMLISIPMLLALLLLINHCGSSTTTLEHQCIHDSEKIQTLIHGPVVDAKTGLRHGFTPQGILERTTPQQYQPMPPSNASDEVHRAFHATAFGNIRFRPSVSDLYNPRKYCTQYNDVRPDFKGNKVKCGPKDTFTDAKRDILLNNALPAALDMLSGALKVKQVVGNMIIPGCEHYTVPKVHKTTGVSKADYVLYVSAAPTAGTVAWAGYCGLDTAGRPIFGRANFAPQYIVWNDLDTNAQRQLVRTAAHEILHAIGFTSFIWSTKFPSGKTPIASETRRGKTVKYFSSKKVVEMAKEQFDCPTMKGPEMEDTGGDLTAGSHWKRRNHMDDMMTGISTRWSYLSPITLAVMEDSGHYKVDWSKAENPNWMYKAGCGVIDDTCNTTAGGLGKYFCNEEVEDCTSDHRSIGLCRMGTYEEDLPSWAQYFPGEPDKGGATPFMEFCPIIRRYSDRQCDNPANSGHNNTVIPEYYGYDGRCFRTKGVVQQRHEMRVKPVSCLQTKCVNNAVKFKMPEKKEWIDCPSKGAQVTLSQHGYDGTVTCPDPVSVCDGVEISPTTTTAQSTTTAAPATTAAPTTTENATTVTKSPKHTVKSATAISSTIPAVLISSVVFIYLYNW